MAETLGLDEILALIQDIRFYFHLMFFIILYIAMKKMTHVLDRPFPWSLARQYQVSMVGLDRLDHGQMRTHITTHWYLSKIIKVMMLLCVLQAAATGYLIVDKCRWNRAGQEIVKLYKDIDFGFRPKLTPSLSFMDFTIVFSYFAGLNGAAISVVYLLYRVYRGGRPGDDRGAIHSMKFSLIPLTILWFTITYRIFHYCSHSEELFIDYFTKLNN